MIMYHITFISCGRDIVWQGALLEAPIPRKMQRRVPFVSNGLRYSNQRCASNERAGANPRMNISCKRCDKLRFGQCKPATAIQIIIHCAGKEA